MATIIETEDDIASTLETPVDTNDVSLQVEYLFASSIWQAKAPQFLDSVTAVHKEVIAQRKKEAEMGLGQTLCPREARRQRLQNNFDGELNVYT